MTPSDSCSAALAHLKVRLSDVAPGTTRLSGTGLGPRASLNVPAFVLVGFQLKDILGRLDSRTLLEYAGIAATIRTATMVARIAWVSGASAFARWRARRWGGRSDASALSKDAAAVVGWCGMRGIVTLAAALALPTGGHGGPGFPFRDLILFTAFSVVLGTLVVQGMTLRPLLNALELEVDDSVEREVLLARVETLRAALQATSEQPDAEMSGLLRRRYAVLLQRSEADLARGGRGAHGDGTDAGRAFDLDLAIIRKVAEASRHRLIMLRAAGTIGDAAFQRIEQELDVEEMDLWLLTTGASPEES